MFTNIYVWLVGLVVGVHLIAYIAYCRSRRQRSALTRRATTEFGQRREWIEAEFVTVASGLGKPRGLRWKNVEFDNGVSFARDRNSGELRAFAGVTIAFEAIEDGGMEDVEAVSNLRTATSVFHYTDGRWTTDGRTLFNLDPDEAVLHFQHELDPISS